MNYINVFIPKHGRNYIIPVFFDDKTLKLDEYTRMFITNLMVDVKKYSEVNFYVSYIPTTPSKTISKFLRGLFTDISDNVIIAKEWK